MKKHLRKRFFRVLFVGACTVMAVMAHGTEPAMARPDPTPGVVQRDAGYGSIALFFIPNQGQMDERVAYTIQGKDKSVYFTPDGLTFVLTEQVKAPPARKKRFLREIEPAETGQQTHGKRWVVKLDFVGARRDVRPESLEQAETMISYFKGQPEEWKTGLQTSAKIIYRDLWPGIDLIYYGTVNRLKYDFIVHPGADPTQIRLSYRGADSVTVTGEGRLEVATPLGVFQDDIPVAWQEMDGKKVDVFVSYALVAAPKVQVASLSLSANDSLSTPGINPQHQGHVYRFAVGRYDPSRTLVLDPAMLIYCGYIGGSDWEDGYGIAVDSAGNAYVTGRTESTQATFPVTVGPDLTHTGGNYDAFVAKVNAAGTALAYCGYIGGAGLDEGRGIAVDSAGNAYVTGITESAQATFPVTMGPDLTHNGESDAFVAKVNAAGTALVYCGYIGGSKSDKGYGIAVDSAGNAYITGITASTEATFPVAVGPDLTYNGGYFDAFVAKVNAAGTALDYCGYIGGSETDGGYGIAVDSTGNAYVTGDTASTEATFPVAVGPDLTHNGSFDAFVAKVDATGTALAYCGYIGGSKLDQGYGIAVDSTGNAYITGSALSPEATFPVTVGPDLTHNGEYDAFVAKVNAAGTALVYCGYIGGSGLDDGYGIAVDSEGNAYVTGSALSTEVTFPVKVGPDMTHNGSGDAFVAKVNAAGTALVYCGYIGGSGYDQGHGIAVDSEGNSYIIGRTASTEATFPVVAGPDLNYSGGTYDAFVAKIRAFTGALYFPHVDTNLPWQTEIAVINTSDQTVTGALRALSNTGQLVDTKSVTLSARGRRQITVATEFTNPTNIGYIVFDTDSAAVQGYTKFYQTGVYRAAIPAVKEVNTSDIYISHIDSSALWWTGVSLVNTTSARKDLTIIFNNGLSVPYTLNANEHAAFTIGGLLNQPLQPDIKSAVISNAGGVIGLELFGSSGGASQLDGLLLSGNTASTITYPHVASDNTWWTGIVAYNPSASGATITITPYSAQGVPLTPSTLSIAGKGKYVGLVSALGLPSQTAWFKIDSTSPLSGFELFATWDGQLLAAYAGGGTGAKAGIFPKIEKSGWTGIAFVNTEASAATVTLTAYNDNGTVVATQVLPVSGYAKVVDYAEAIFSQNISGATYIAYSSDRNVVGFQLNGSADGMMLDGLPGLAGSH